MPARTKRQIGFAGVFVAVAGAATGTWLWVQASRADSGAGGAPPAPVIAADTYTFECVSITSGGGALADPGTGTDRGFVVVGQTAPGVMTGPGYTFEIGIVPCLFPGVGSDLDGDSDVDLTDFARFQACFNGPNRPAKQTNCGGADLDTDTDVDLMDFAGFQACFNGPNRPPKCQ